ncbi:MAG TPA: redoxin domain-containing protein [Burkholderiales bacterium]|nr:redoxin domain-containing protein [Burkholderiales bacterium]
MLLRKFAQTTLIGLGVAFVPVASFAVAEIDQPAPGFSGVDAAGKPVNLNAYKGKTVVLEWTNHECPFVVKHYESGNIPNLQKDAVGKGVVWLQVISSAPGKQGHVDGPTAVKLNTDRGAAPTATMLDPEGKIGALYGAQTTPHIYIINPAGKLVYKGGIDSIPSSKKEDIAKAENYVKSALTALAAGQKVTNASTKPYGCSVKYSG